MKRADTITFLGALIIVVIIAVVSQGSGSIPGIESIPGFAPPAPPYESPTDTIPIYTLQEKPEIWNIPKNTDLNSVYMSGKGGYPVTDFPADMTIFGASDPEYQEIWTPGEIVLFAQYTGPGNGFTEMFHTPFSFWRINTTITETNKPGSAMLSWVLVNGETGTVVTGNQMKYGEHILKTVQASGEKFYIIVSVQDVNRYSFRLETTKAQYGNTLIQPAVRRINSFLNAA